MTQTVIQGAMIWNGVAEAAFPGTVVVEGNRIAKVIERADLPSGLSDNTIDGTGMTLMPGMVEGHCHPFDAVAEQRPVIVPISERADRQCTAGVLLPGTREVTGLELRSGLARAADLRCAHSEKPA
ncbi:hypothetical protein [uncultured Roseibium sp.]|uniref:hypothetical protein n=1 Tax=uncultured Roseibium sp. TaxID=1936171 RepID=UPI00261C345E|nr:hypothetical protein [uncultured Roseibium sp.]